MHRPNMFSATHPDGPHLKSDVTFVNRLRTFPFRPGGGRINDKTLSAKRFRTRLDMIYLELGTSTSVGICGDQSIHAYRHSSAEAMRAPPKVDLSSPMGVYPTAKRTIAAAQQYVIQRGLSSSATDTALSSRRLASHLERYYTDVLWI